MIHPRRITQSITCDCHDEDWGPWSQDYDCDCRLGQRDPSTWICRRCIDWEWKDLVAFAAWLCYPQTERLF